LAKTRNGKFLQEQLDTWNRVERAIDFRFLEQILVLQPLSSTTMRRLPGRKRSASGFCSVGYVFKDFLKYKLIFINIG
jgi:hypothetical protein